jgi:hypothetical protein
LDWVFIGFKIGYLSKKLLNYALNFFAFLSAFIVALSPDNTLSAPMFFPLVGQPYFALKIEQLQKKKTRGNAHSIFFIAKT